MLTRNEEDRVSSSLGAVRDVLGQIEETTSRLNRATTGFDESAQRARTLIDSAGDLGDTRG